MGMDPQQIAYARLVVARLERLSVDSYWAHRASGVRGALLRAIDAAESGEAGDDECARNLERLVQAGFAILEKGAREIRGGG